jgi:hypothetical protein
MKVSHARATAVTSTDETAGQAGGEVPGMLEVLALVPDMRKRRGRRFALVFILAVAVAVAVACVLAGAKSFREIGDHAADLPQEVLARLGGTPRPLLRRIVAPSEKRIRTLIQELDAENLDEIIGGWLRDLAGTGRLEHLLTAIAIDVLEVDDVQVSGLAEEPVAGLEVKVAGNSGWGGSLLERGEVSVDGGEVCCVYERPGVGGPVGTAVS